MFGCFVEGSKEEDCVHRQNCVKKDSNANRFLTVGLGYHVSYALQEAGNFCTVQVVP